MKILKKGDTIKMGVYCGMTVGECIKQYGKKALLEVLRYYDLDDELSRKYYHKKEEIQTNEKQDEDPHLWEGTDRNYQEFFEVYDEMQSSDFYDGVDDEYWYSLYVEGKNPVSWTSDGDEYEPETYNYEPEELSEKQMVREMCNKGYKYWIYG